MNLRWVITYDTGKGYRTLAHAAQGRETFATEADAAEWLASAVTNNSAERLASIFGPLGAATLRVQQVECWPGHNDPKRTVFEP